MASYNRIIILGNLTRDPKLSYDAGNKPRCNFGIATNRKWKTKDGVQKEDVCFVDCVLFGKGAEVFNEHMSVGRAVLVEGRLTLHQFQTDDGQKRSKHEVFVENFTFVGAKEDNAPTTQAAEAVAIAADATASDNDDIPF